MPVRVFIVSDVRLLREGLATLLRKCPAIEVLGSDSVPETPGLMLTMQPDVALVDSLSPGDSDVVISDVAMALRNPCPRIRIVAFGIRETTSEVLACAAAGIDGYVPKDATLDDMVTAIENAVRGELACSPKVAASLYHCLGFSRTAIANSRTAMAMASPLTTRELQVADLMNRGCPTKEIAWRLGVRPCTAKNHVRNILHKLQVRRRGQAVAKLRTLIGEHFSDDRFGSDTRRMGDNHVGDS